MNDFPVVLIVIVLALVVFMIAAMWKIYEKAGQPGWQQLFPFTTCIFC
jgi:hypothetical protein